MHKCIYKESVELTFVYLTEGCGKTLTIDKRHNTPHSDRYGISEAQNAPTTSIYTKVSAVRLVLIVKKTSTFSVKDLRKTLSQYVMPDGITA